MPELTVPRPRSRVRRQAELLVVAAIGWLLVRTWLVEGLVIPLMVPSGSMAETLLGYHRQVTCADCGRPFVCGTDLPPVAAAAVCPNCGYAGNDLRQQPDLDGDRLLMDKCAFRLRRPRRWEIVAFRHPQQAEALCVKRVVGLPGETVQIRRGDVYIDGRLQRKTLAQQRALAILVHDANCAPTLSPALPARWRGDGGSAWQLSGGRFFHPATADQRTVDWCVYHHQRRSGGSTGGVRELPVDDDCGYNQNQPQRADELHDVTDLLLSLRLVRVSGEGRLWVRASDGQNEFVLQIEPGRGRFEVRGNGQPIPGGEGRLPGGMSTARLEVSLVDRQFLAALDGRPLVTWPYELSHREAWKPTPRPLAIGDQGLEVEMGDVRVYRDVYYTRPGAGDGRWGLDTPVHLGPDEYFVLGDNSPVSDDSRTWAAGPAVPAHLLYGKPLLVHFPARQVDFWGRHFQLPDLTKIRYIR